MIKCNIMNTKELERELERILNNTSTYTSKQQAECIVQYLIEKEIVSLDPQDVEVIEAEL